MLKIKRNRKNLFKKLTKWFLASCLFATLFGAFSIFAVFSYYSKDLPDLKKISEEPMVQSTKIYDRTGAVVLYDIYGEEKRTVVPFEKISQSVKDAVIATEDARFYKHIGLDLKSIARAFIVNFTNKGTVQGGSTITQQLVKNYFLTKDKTFSRKIKEVVLSLGLERKYSKEEILGFYLNQIPYGTNAYGIESASITFFNKHADGLSIAESALLTALPKAPSYYSPYGLHKEELLKRKDYILSRMRLLGFITDREYEQAKSENLIFAPQKKSIKAPHFVMYVKDYLESKYGEDFVLKNGLKVYTTLDWGTQQIAEEIVYESALKNQKDYGARNAALAAVDVKTGQILAMVGSYDYFDTKNDGNVNVTIMERQPGSAFKPFAYATAFEKGFTPNTIVFDLPTEFSSYADLCPITNIDFSNENTLCYHPQNYDGKFRGPVDLKHSLAQSLNVPSVKTLYLAGIKETTNLAKKLGISSLKNDNDYGLSLVLGAAEVKPLDMASAYAVFANDGIKINSSVILKIEDSQGVVLEEQEIETSRAIDIRTARQITNILSDNEARAPVFGVNNLLHIDNLPVAAKTGTTQDYKDAWVVGYSPDISVAVWVGNNNGDKISRSGAGISAAGPIWNKFMKKILEKNPPKNQFTPPEPIITTKDILNGLFETSNKIKIDRASGKLATENTPADFIEEKLYGAVHSLLYYINKSNPQGDRPLNPEEDSQFKNWEAPVLEWVTTQNESGKNFNQPPPTETDDIHTKENLPKISIISPLNNEVLNNSYLLINTSILTAFPIKQVDFFIDNQLLGSLFKYPYSLNFPASKINPSSNFNRNIKVVAYDIYSNRKEESINFFLPTD